jgi:hypothetical protein
VIQHICPDFMDSETIRDMKNTEKGALVTFDTSALKESHYFVGMDDSEKYSVDSQSQYDERESFESEGNDKNKLRKFHKARCKAWIISVENIDGKQYNCVLFVETGGGDELSPQRAELQVELNDIKNVELDDQKGDDASIVGEDNTENKQEEDIRHIKDSRAMLNERKNSKSIRTLQRLFIAFALICIGSEIFLRVNRTTSTTVQNSYINRFISLFQRNSIMTDIGYYLRKYEKIIK